MAKYSYNISRIPSIQKLNSDILASSISVKSLKGCSWAGFNRTVTFEFEDEVTEWDKVILETIAIGMPRGFEILNFSNAPTDRRWQQRCGYVSFNRELPIVPISIEISNLWLNGLSSLVVEEITVNGFRFSVSNTKSGSNLGAIEVSFNWEAKA